MNANRSATSLTVQRLLALGLIAGAMSLIVYGSILLPRLTIPKSNYIHKPILSVAPQYLNFGEAWESADFKWDLPLENRSSEEIEIEGFRSSCSCTSVSPPSLRLMPGETRSITATINLFQRPNAKEQDAVPFDISISPKLKGVLLEDKVPVLRLRGKVRKVLVMDKNAIDLGRVSHLKQPIEPRRLVVTSLANPPLAELQVECSIPSIKSSILPLQDGSQRFEVLVTPMSLPKGPIDAELVFTPTLPSGKRLSPYRVPVSGIILDDIQPSVPHIVFGAAEQAEFLNETVTFASLTNRPFRLIGFQTTTPGPEITVPAEASSSAITVYFRQKVATLGESKSTISFTFKDSLGNETKITIRLSYFGVSKTRSTDDGINRTLTEITEIGKGATAEAGRSK